MIREFIYNGHSSREFGILITDKPNVYGAPKSDIQAVSVPGRSGDLLFNNHRFENYEVEYQCGIMGKDTDERMKRIKAWLYSSVGYMPLSDSFISGYHRMAAFMSSIVPTSSYSITKFTVKFNCQPFMYLDSGKQEQELVVTDIAKGNRNIFVNPEPFEARPIFKISMQYNAGMTISIGDKSIRIDESGSKTKFIIDTEIRSCYYGGENLNRFISSADLALPTGEFEIFISSRSIIERVTMLPRWRCI